MTGHGLGTARVSDGGAALELELRTVNHRFLDVRVRAPRELLELVPLIEHLTRDTVSRGRIDVVLRTEGLRGRAHVRLDRERAAAAYRDLLALRDEVAPSEPVPISLLASVPDLFTTDAPSDDEDAVRAAVRAAYGAALTTLTASRIEEGHVLARDLGNRVRRVEELVTFIESRAPEIVAGQRRRLRERADRLKSALDVPIDEARLEAEVVMIADRVDIAEELTRLRLHAEKFASLLTSEETAVGRRLEFLLQEMQREANTTAAKSSDAPVSHAVVDIKVEIERMREQVQNVE